MDKVLMVCSCKKWEQGMPSLRAAVIIAQRHGFGYEGRVIKYCPWCGKKLKKKDQ